MSAPWMDVSTGSGVRRRVRFDSTERLLVTEITQPNMNAIIEENKRWLNARSAKAVTLASPTGWTKVATIPNWLLEHWIITGQGDYRDPNDAAKIVALLNSNEYCHLRTAHGTLDVERREF